MSRGNITSNGLTPDFDGRNRLSSRINWRDYSSFICMQPSILLCLDAAGFQNNIKSGRLDKVLKSKTTLSFLGLSKALFGKSLSCCLSLTGVRRFLFCSRCFKVNLYIKNIYFVWNHLSAISYRLQILKPVTGGRRWIRDAWLVNGRVGRAGRLQAAGYKVNCAWRWNTLQALTPDQCELNQNYC
jgi:hypothetical protein